MAKVKIGFSGLDVPQQVERTRLIKGKMTGNANYTSPNPTLAAVTVANDALETAYNASRGHDKVKLVEMRLRRKDLLFLIGQLASYVQEASGADGEVILSSGFDLVKDKTPKPKVAGEVHNLRLIDGSNSGKIKALWNKATDAVMYQVEISQMADFSMLAKRTFTSKTQKEISGLTTGLTYYVRITALGKEEEGPVSASVTIMVR